MPTPTLTLDQFLELEETKPATEYACGRTFQKPMPTTQHGLIAQVFSVLLYPFLEQTGLGITIPELRCIFGPAGRERAYVPDLIFVTKSHYPGRGHLFRAPDLAVEVLSPDQHWPEFLDKIQFYLQNGVRLVWIVDPETRTIAVEAPGKEGQVLQAGDTLTGGDVLPGLSVSVDRIMFELDRFEPTA